MKVKINQCVGLFLSGVAWAAMATPGPGYEERPMERMERPLGRMERPALEEVEKEKINHSSFGDLVEKIIKARKLKSESENKNEMIKEAETVEKLPQTMPKTKEDQDHWGVMVASKEEKYGWVVKVKNTGKEVKMLWTMKGHKGWNVGEPCKVLKENALCSFHVPFEAGEKVQIDWDIELGTMSPMSENVNKEVFWNRKGSLILDRK